MTILLIVPTGGWADPTIFANPLAAAVGLVLLTAGVGWFWKQSCLFQ